MDTQRSPQSTKKVNRPVGQKQCSKCKCKAQLDSSRDSDDDSGSKITYRKRNQREFCDIVTEINNFRGELISILESNLSTMRDDISAMKNQINEIKTSTSKMLAEQKSVKSEIIELKKNNSIAESKISELEAKLSKLECISTKPRIPDVLDNEEIINELQERANRSVNIIVFGINEQTNADSSARQAMDLSLAQKIFQNVTAENPKIYKTMRLGKYSKGKNRPLKKKGLGVLSAAGMAENLYEEWKHRHGL
ncbi:unnamed protein product [Danaus chrysippus]|uniref:(African queen) hypothetical protein n=1 Tax=Danaus chrysippus TaxID=151541 RepID=A0A8J2QGV5_9NEOP|nr:unnamed protein product [Danaus chrysippus]